MLTECVVVVGGGGGGGVVVVVVIIMYNCYFSLFWACCMTHITELYVKL
jgi:hypothetical protein